MAKTKQKLSHEFVALKENKDWKEEEMRLELDPLDLATEFQKMNEGEPTDQAISTSKVSFEHLNEAAQKAVVAVGRATFFNWTRKNYNTIYPPK